MSWMDGIRKKLLHRRKSNSFSKTLSQMSNSTSESDSDSPRQLVARSHPGQRRPRSCADDRRALSDSAPVLRRQRAEGRAPITSIGEIGVSTTQNSRFRATMEDACTVVESFGSNRDQVFLGLYDGHGGDSCATYAAKNLHRRYLRRLKELGTDGDSAAEQNPQDEAREDPELSAFSLCYQDIDDEIAALSQDWSDAERDVGTTASTSLLRRTERGIVIYHANVGDSRSIVCRDGEAIRLSKDHLPADPEEVQRIRNAGGIIFKNRVGGVLAVTRALGHSGDKNIVVGEPHITKHMVSAADEFLLTASDGLWDVLKDEEVAEFVKNRLYLGVSAKKIAQQLVKEAISRHSRDNISVMLVVFSL